MRFCTNWMSCGLTRRPALPSAGGRAGCAGGWGEGAAALEARSTALAEEGGISDDSCGDLEGGAAASCAGSLLTVSATVQSNCIGSAMARPPRSLGLQKCLRDRDQQFCLCLQACDGVLMSRKTGVGTVCSASRGPFTCHLSRYDKTSIERNR